MQAAAATRHMAGWQVKMVRHDRQNRTDGPPSHRRMAGAPAINGRMAEQDGLTARRVMHGLVSERHAARGTAAIAWPDVLRETIFAIEPDVGVALSNILTQPRRRLSWLEREAIGGGVVIEDLGGLLNEKRWGITE